MTDQFIGGMIKVEPYTPEPWTHVSYPGKVVAESEDALWMSVPMAFGNHRLVGMPKAPNGMEQDWNPVWGWCYRGELALMSAVNIWDPVTEDEPQGWHKRAGDVRRARIRHEDPEYNRPRCVHGSYFAMDTCRIDAHCPEFRERGLRR